MLKRACDIIISLMVLILMAPLFLLCMIWIRIETGGSVFFRQKRTGMNGKSFYILKFQSMIEKKDKNGRNLPDLERLTVSGKFLRMFSMDELPNFFNVLAGQMSVVGPRPLLPEYEGLYSERHQKRFDVKPGITGWAQVNGRNLLSWHEKMEHDIWYVENRSAFLDVKILIKTVLILFLNRNSGGQGTHLFPEGYSDSRFSV